MATIGKNLHDQAESVETSMQQNVASNRIPSLDGLRGVAIALVLIFHLIYKHPLARGIWHYAVIAGGLSWSGVDLFFVLSGFLIGGILLDTKDSLSYYQTFYARRATRILPIYWILLSLFALRYLPIRILPSSLGMFSNSEIPWWAYVAFIQNFWMAAIGGLGVGLLTPTWSLAIEEQFYLTIPFLVRKLTRTRLVVLLITIVIAVPIFRVFLFHHLNDARTACYVLMPCRADALSFGVLAAALVRERTIRLISLRKMLYFLDGVLLAALVAFTCQESLTPVWVSLRYSILAIFYTCVLLTVLAAPYGWGSRILSHSALRKLGTISYFTYLYHIPLIELARRAVTTSFTKLEPETAELVGFSIGVAVTLILASFSWRFLEDPLVRWGKSFQYDPASHR